MDFYKKILTSRRVRVGILRMLRFIPDEPMIRFQYRVKTGNKLNLDKPQRFTEKLQWLKLHYRDPRMVTCVDKYDVRSYVAEQGLEDILVPCIGVFDSADEVPWEELPASFVVKDTLGGGGNSIAIVHNKEAADKNEVQREMRRWLSHPAHQKNSGREWPYYSGKERRIIVEEMIGADNQGTGLIDYKFFCFNGVVKFLYVTGNRRPGESVDISILNRDFELLPVRRVGDKPFDDVEKPVNFNRMIQVAETLSADFPHVRVDLYNVDGRILFGELTFFNASGYMLFDPDSFDLEAGSYLQLPAATV